MVLFLIHTLLSQQNLKVNKHPPPLIQQLLRSFYFFFTQQTVARYFQLIILCSLFIALLQPWLKFDLHLG